jgi:hypothetical protein
MRLTSFFQVCVYFCLFLLIFTLSVNFVTGLQLFIDVETGPDLSGETTAEGVFSRIVDNDMFAIWAMVTSLSGLAAGVLAVLTRSVSILGVYLFSVTFWTSYTLFVSTVNINSWIPLEFMLIFTVALLFIWVAAIIGMLTGSG